MRISDWSSDVCSSDLPVHTFMDERTNATFYSDVRVEDKDRLGEINGGAKVLASALSMEQSGGYYHILIREMADTVADWAREEQRDGTSLIENDGVRSEEHTSALTCLLRNSYDGFC